MEQHRISSGPTWPEQISMAGASLIPGGLAGCCCDISKCFQLWKCLAGLHELIFHGASWVCSFHLRAIWKGVKPFPNMQARAGKGCSHSLVGPKLPPAPGAWTIYRQNHIIMDTTTSKQFVHKHNLLSCSIFFMF